MEIKVPEVGESVYEALLAKWFKKNGDYVSKDQQLCELETDKITFDLNADVDGRLAIEVEEGTMVKIGAILGRIIETPADDRSGSMTPTPDVGNEDRIMTSLSSPAVRYEMREENIAPELVTATGKGGRITLDDLFSRIEQTSRRSSEPAESMEPVVVPDSAPPELPAAGSPSPVIPDVVPSVAPVHRAVPAFVPEPPSVSVRSETALVYSAGRDEVRKPLSPLRKRIGERLLIARQQTAMLTTFNEADLGHIKELREKYKEHFRQRHGVSLGFMPFFVRACVEALKEFPAVNASIDGNDMVYHNFYDIGIAIGGEKGLVVPILRNADRLRLYEIDQAIADFADKITTNRLAISDLEGGTFTISNGGVYGSMLSTPIINPPQSGVLGMHAIQDRPVVRDGQIVIRPMMYLALSYDHRVIDGREAVGFLRRVKEYIESPEELLLEG